MIRLSKLEHEISQNECMIDAYPVTPLYSQLCDTLTMAVSSHIWVTTLTMAVFNSCDYAPNWWPQLLQLLSSINIICLREYTCGISVTPNEAGQLMVDKVDTTIKLMISSLVFFIQVAPKHYTTAQMWLLNYNCIPHSPAYHSWSWQQWCFTVRSLCHFGLRINSIKWKI
jgi:hypothetical protein